MSTDLATEARADSPRAHLLCRAAERWCALPLESVIETFRPIDVRAVAGAPAFLRGVIVLRGEPVPIVDAGVLLGCDSSRGERLVALRAGSRKVALAVDEVVRVRELATFDAAETVPLVQAAEPRVIECLGALDAQLLYVLSSARLVPADLWHALEERTRAA